MHILGIDIGGSGIKGALVDLESGTLVTKKHRIPTPESRVPEDVLPVIKELVEHFEYSGPIGVGFPAVVVDGVVKTSFTALDIREWIGCDVAQSISQMTGMPTRVINDADAAGMAEMAYGAGKGQAGTAIMITLGTGIGSGVFYDGKLVPNTEFGKLYLKDQKKFVERYAAESIRIEDDLSWQEWGKRLDDLFEHLEHIMTPQLFIVGGGVSKHFDEFEPYIKIDTPIVPAVLRNPAGIIGAAMAAPVNN